MNDFLKRLLEYCDKNNCEILRTTIDIGSKYNMAVVVHENGDTENIYSKFDTWEFE